MNKTKTIEKLHAIQRLASECLIELQDASTITPSSRPQKARTVKKESERQEKIDFSTPIRPFVKLHCKNMSGPKKFTLILAHLVHGKLHESVDLTEVEKVWNSMTAILGMKFNRFYSQTAKDNDWVISEKKGSYSLRPSWMEIFN